MNKRCALIKDGIVENLVIADLNKDVPPEGYQAVEIPEDAHVNHGFIYDGSSFHPPQDHPHIIRATVKGLLVKGDIAAPKIGDRPDYTLDTPLSEILEYGDDRAKALWQARGNPSQDVSTCPALVWARSTAQPNDTLKDFVVRITDGLKAGTVQPQWVLDFLNIEGPVLPKDQIETIINSLPSAYMRFARCCAEAQSP